MESRSDGVHRIHWTRIDSDGKVHFSIRERLRKISLMLDEGVESRSDGVHRIHWRRIDSDGKVHYWTCVKVRVGAFWEDQESARRHRTIISCCKSSQLRDLQGWEKD